MVFTAQTCNSQQFVVQLKFFESIVNCRLPIQIKITQPSTQTIPIVPIFVPIIITNLTDMSQSANGGTGTSGLVVLLGRGCFPIIMWEIPLQGGLRGNFPAESRGPTSSC